MAKNGLTAFTVRLTAEDHARLRAYQICVAQKRGGVHASASQAIAMLLRALPPNKLDQATLRAAGVSAKKPAR
jgi:hypothetical protein